MVTQRSETTDKQPVKVYWLYIPTPKPSILRLIVLAIGVIVSWVLGLATIMIPVLIIGEGFPNYFPPAWFPIAVFVCAGYGPILWLYYYNRFNNRRLMNLTIDRSNRLARLIDHPDSLLRLPQRHIENLMRNTNYSQKKLNRLLQQLPSSSIFIINALDYNGYSIPEYSKTPFEPIEVQVDTGHIQELINEHLGMDGYEYWESDDRTEQEIKSQQRGYLKKYVGYIFSKIFWLVFLVFGVYRITAGDPIGWFYILGPTIGVIVGLFTDAFANRRWWLVPGGLIYREDFAWRKGMRCSLITPDQSPLLLDWRTGIGMVVDGDKLRRFPMGEHARWLVAAGWVSQARTPTPEEAKSFLGMSKE